MLARDPSVVTAYVNRGYLLNDLHQPQAAAADFEAALNREPHDGEAHLGLAYADLDLDKPKPQCVTRSSPGGKRQFARSSRDSGDGIRPRGHASPGCP